MKTVLRTFIYALVFLTTNLCISQISYPKGIYKTFEDFIRKTPSDTLTPFIIKTGNNIISHRFFNAITNKRLKREFAFSDGKDLYVSIKGIIKKFHKSDKSQVKDDGNYHLKAEQIGNRYIYFEDYFTSKSAVIFGGIIAGSAARRLKAIIYDLENNDFDLFKNADDFEFFIKENHSAYIANLPKQANKDGKNKRKKRIEDLDLIRKIITEINSKQ